MRGRGGTEGLEVGESEGGGGGSVEWVVGGGGTEG